MKRDEIELGQVYAVKVSGRVVPVQVLSSAEPSHWGPRGLVRAGWHCRNRLTGRTILVKSAQRFRRRIAGGDAT